MTDKILAWVSAAVGVVILFWLLVIKGLFGVFLAAVGVIWLLGLILRPYASRLYAVRVKTKIAEADMPRLRPLPIPTHDGDWMLKILVWLSEPRRWKLGESWSYKLTPAMARSIGRGSGTEDPGLEVVIPEGFEVDGASVPRPFWTFFSPTGILLIPAIVHDHAYGEGKLLLKKADGTEEDVSVDRRQADDLFFHMFVEVNGMPWLAWLPYAVLRLFGFFVYNPPAETGAKPEAPKPAESPEGGAPSSESSEGTTESEDRAT